MQMRADPNQRNTQIKVSVTEARTLLKPPAPAVTISTCARECAERLNRQGAYSALTARIHQLYHREGEGVEPILQMLMTHRIRPSLVDLRDEPMATAGIANWDDNAVLPVLVVDGVCIAGPAAGWLAQMEGAEIPPTKMALNLGRSLASATEAPLVAS